MKNFSNHLIQFLWLALLILTLTVLPTNFWLAIPILKNDVILFLIFTLLIVTLISVKKIKFNNYILVYFGFTLLHFASWFWAKTPSLIFPVSTNVLITFCFLVIAFNTNFKNFSFKLFSKTIIIISILNAAFLFEWLTQLFINSGYQYSFITFRSTNELSSFFSYNSNFISTTILYALPFIFAIYKFKSLNKFLFYALLFSSSVILFLLNSRGNFYAFIVVLIILFYDLYKSNFKAKSIVFGVLFVMLSFGFSYSLIKKDDVFIEKLGVAESINQQSGDERVLLWKRALKLFNENKLLGVGADNYKIEYLKYGFSNVKRNFVKTNKYTHAHSMFFQYLSEFGLIGFCVLLFVYLYPIYIVLFNYNKKYKFIILAFFIIHIFSLSVYFHSFTDGFFLSLMHLLWLAIVALVLQNYKTLNNIKFNFKLLLFALLTIVFCCTLYYRNKIIQTKKVRTLTKLKKHEEAQLIAEKIYNPIFYQIQRNTSVYKFNYSNYLKSKNFEKAIEYLEKSIKIIPYHFEDFYYLGNLYKRANQNEKAKLAYEKCFQMHNCFYKNNMAAAKLAVKLNNTKDFIKYTSFYKNGILKTKNKLRGISDHPNAIAYWKKMDKYEKEILKLSKELGLQNYLDN